MGVELLEALILAIIVVAGVVSWKLLAEASTQR
jgi:hypothetical protein